MARTIKDDLDFMANDEDLKRMFYLGQYFNAKEYYNQFKVAFDGEKPNVLIANEDEEHNAVVIQFLLDRCKEIKMFCQRMSVLRDEFYIKNDCLFDLRKPIIASLRNFLENTNNKLSIILTQGDEIGDFVLGDLKPYIDRGTLAIRTLSESCPFKSSFNHFTIGTFEEKGLTKSVVRMEGDRKRRSATCAVNHSEMLAFFDKIFKDLSMYCDEEEDRTSPSVLFNRWLMQHR